MISKSKVPHFTVKSRNPDAIMIGRNTIVEMDGKPVKYLTSFEFKVDAIGVAKIKLEMVGDVELDAHIAKEDITFSEKGYSPEVKTLMPGEYGHTEVKLTKKYP